MRVEAFNRLHGPGWPCPEQSACRGLFEICLAQRGWICGVVRVTGRPLLEFSNRLAEFACLVQFFQNVPALLVGQSCG